MCMYNYVLGPGEMDGSRLEKTELSFSVTMIIERVEQVTLNTWKFSAVSV